MLLLQDIYVLGGTRGENAVSVVEHYSGNGNEMPNLMSARPGATIGRVGNLVCQVGGRWERGDDDGWTMMTECLDTTAGAQGRWQSVATMSYPRSHFALASVSDRMCAIGGLDLSVDPHASTKVECYNPNTGHWAEVAELNTGRAHHGAAAIGNVIFVVGGSFESHPCWGDSECELVGEGRALEALDLSVSGGSWAQKAPMPAATTYRRLWEAPLAVASSGNKLFALGNKEGAHPSLDIYDSTTNSWVTGAPNLPTTRYNLGLAIAGHILLAMGGETSVSSEQTDSNEVASVEAYDIVAGCWSTLAALRTPRGSFSVLVLP